VKVYSRWDGLPAATYPPLLEHNSQFVTTDNLRNADVILLPYAEIFDEYPDSWFQSLTKLNDAGILAARAEFSNLLCDVRESTLPSVLFRHSDFEHSERFEAGLTFQTSLNSETRRSSDFALPGFVAPDVAKASLTATKSNFAMSRPTVGFRGSARPSRISVERTVRDLAAVARRLGFGAGDNIPSGISGLVQRAAWDVGQLLRSQAMSVLELSPDVDADFTSVLRGYIGAGAQKQARNRAIFLDCLRESQYSLCVRGRGNFSYRFYETLAMRRIPLLLDTNCVLPFDHELNWDDLVVRVDAEAVTDMARLLLEFHTGSTNTQLGDMQDRGAEVWQNYLDPPVFWERAGRLIVERI
jgi:hypothetical protein